MERKGKPRGRRRYKYGLVSRSRKGPYSSMRKRQQVQRSRQGPLPGWKAQWGRACRVSGEWSLRPRGRGGQLTKQQESEPGRSGPRGRGGRPPTDVRPAARERVQRVLREQARGRQRPRGTGPGAPGAATTGPPKHREGGHPRASPTHQLLPLKPGALPAGRTMGHSQMTKNQAPLFPQGTGKRSGETPHRDRGASCQPLNPDSTKQGSLGWSCLASKPLAEVRGWGPLSVPSPAGWQSHEQKANGVTILKPWFGDSLSYGIK